MPSKKPLAAHWFFMFHHFPLVCGHLQFQLRKTKLSLLRSIPLFYFPAIKQSLLSITTYFTWSTISAECYLSSGKSRFSSNFQTLTEVGRKNQAQLFFLTNFEVFGNCMKRHSFFMFFIIGSQTNDNSWSNNNNSF